MGAILAGIIRLAVLLLGAYLDPDARRKREKARRARKEAEELFRIAVAVETEDGEVVDAIIEDLLRSSRR